MKHRSSKAVRLWLRTRLWYGRYKKNLHNEYDDKEEESYFLNGLYGESTIASAFYFSSTPEGVEYWGKKEERFLRWYYYQGKEIFRCKWFSIQIKW